MAAAGIAIPIWSIVDSSGASLASAKVNAWVPSSAGAVTAVRRSLYTDAALSTPADNPYTLGTSGHGVLYRNRSQGVVITVTNSAGTTTYATVYYKADSEEGIFIPLNYGAAGDGSTNDATAIAACATAANAAGGIMDGLGLTYKINTGCAVSRRMRDIKFDVSSVTASTATSIGTYVVGIYVDGGDIWAVGYAKTTLAGVESRGDDTIAVASGGVTAAGLAVADKILIWEDAAWGGSGQAKKTDWKTIKTISSDNITLAAELDGSYTSSCTVRKMPAVDVDWENITVTGANTAALDQVGVIITHCRDVRMTNCVGKNLDYESFLIIENFSVELSGVNKAENADDTGLGYGFNISGNGSVVADTLLGYNCKHVVTGGSGAGSNYPLQRFVSIGQVIGHGCTDASFDQHPGTDLAMVGRIYGSYRADAATDGDGVVFQGSQLMVGEIYVYSPKRHGFLQQWYGDGDGKEVSTYIGKLTVINQNTGVAYGAVFDNLDSTNHDALGDIEVGYVNILSPYGLLVTCTQGDIRSFTLNGGNIEHSDTSDNNAAVYMQGSTSYEIVHGYRISNVRIKHADNTGFCLYAQGFSGQLTDGWVHNCSFDGGAYAVRTDYGAMTHTGNHLYGTHATAKFNLGTSGTVPGLELTGSATWDPASIADGDEEVKSVTVTGAALGDYVVACAFSLDVQDLQLSAQVTGTDTVEAQLLNNTGGPIDLGSGTVKVIVRKAA